MSKEEDEITDEIIKMWYECNPVDEGMGCEFANIGVEYFDYIATHFIEFGKQQALKNAIVVDGKDHSDWMGVGIHGVWDKIVDLGWNKQPYDPNVKIYLTK